MQPILKYEITISTIFSKSMLHNVLSCFCVFWCLVNWKILNWLLPMSTIQFPFISHFTAEANPIFPHCTRNIVSSFSIRSAFCIFLFILYTLEIGMVFFSSSLVSLFGILPLLQVCYAATNYSSTSTSVAMFGCNSIKRAYYLIIMIFNAKLCLR